tara:strand:- start:797 stop:1171 length:375 start_codon:yes stop_codon:yes gene_type:complete
MAIPYNSSPNMPQGLETATINLVAYVVDSVSLTSNENRMIERTDSLGDRQDFMIRKSSSQISGSMTLQRATDTTVLPPEGTEFTYDFDRSGTPSTLVVQSVTVNRGTDAFDTFDISIILVSYQA